MPAAERIGVVLMMLALASPALAEDDPVGDADRIQKLEQRVADLEAEKEDAEEDEQADEERGDAYWQDRFLPDWARRVRLGGSANVGYFYRRDVTPEDSNSFDVWDARFFIDADLAEDVEWGETWLVDSIGFHFEWNLVRLGELENDVGDLYVDFQGLGGSGWANATVGRFQIPVGENYLRFGEGYWDGPFISNTVGGPWWWDEGLRAYGRSPGGMWGFVTSVTDGETPFNDDAASSPQGTLKLYTDPTPWLHLSASGLVSGDTGSADSPGLGALWLGEAWARAFGSGSDVPNIVDGDFVADGPNQLDGTWLVAADAILTPWEGALRLWLAWGRYDIDSTGSSIYDRVLHYWIAEVVVEGRAVASWLEPMWLGLRANGLTTGDDDRGYLLDARYGDNLGYNMMSLNEYSAVLGVWLGEHVVVRGQYSYVDIDLVDGVPIAVAAGAEPIHWFAFEVGVGF